MPDKTKAGKQKKQPRKITQSSLRNIALYYLQRYASSKENLKRVLMRRVHKSAQVHELDMDEATGWVDQLVDQLAASGMVDDRTYAEGKMRSLYRRGASPNKISQTLRHKGVSAEIIEETLAILYESAVDPTLVAAIRLAKRRRLGPYCQRGSRQERAQKDLASLARAGFDYQTAHKVIFADTIDQLEEWVDARPLLEHRD